MAGPESAGNLSRRTFFGGALAGCGLAPFAAAQEVQPPRDVVVTGADTLGVISWRNDPYGRISTQVMLNGQGPFRFFVDTGANRSALSASTAARVGAIPAGEGVVHSVSSAEIKPMVTLKSLTCGAFGQEDVRVPIISDELILPVDGMLGMERFAGLRLEFDNTSREMVIKRGARGWHEAMSLPADIRFGQLVAAKGRIGGVNVPIIFDTGAYYALANTALRTQLELRAARLNPTRISTATQPVFVEDSVLIPEIRMENIALRSTAAYVGDFHIFKLWNLIDQPALIVGMNVLQSVKRFAIDYRSRLVQFMS